VNPTPSDWPRFSSAAYYQTRQGHRWLCDAFGFRGPAQGRRRRRRIEHSELTYGEGLLMVAQEDRAAARIWKRAMRSPRSVEGANTQSMMFFVDDADAHCAHARARGARIVEEPATPTTARTTGRTVVTAPSTRGPHVVGYAARA